MRNIFRKYNFLPKKRLGQNFLISEKILRKIIFISKLEKDDIVLEVGAGTGILTKELAKRVKQVIAVEKDTRLIKILEQELKEFKNIKIIQGDILKNENCPDFVENPRFKKSGKPGSRKYKIIANLPYYITAPVIKMFLEAKNPPELMVLMVQKEVGERICASPPTTFSEDDSYQTKKNKQKVVGGRPPKMSKLAVFCQFYSSPKIMAFVSKKCFWPQPKVDSVILKFIPGISQELKGDRFFEKNENRALFSEIVNKGFSHPRKQLINNLSKELDLPREKVESWLVKNNINPTQRAETLTIKNWVDLAKTFDD